MKILVFISCILIILFKTGNVLSNNNIFNVNNVVVNKENSENSENTEKITNQAFKDAFDQLIKRVLLNEDIKKLSNIDLGQIKKLISYYQIINDDQNTKNRKKKINVSFDKDRMHNFFYNRNLLYSDILDTEVVFFPLLKENNDFFIYTQNYFYANWQNENLDNLIQYVLPAESIENIQKINSNSNDIYNLNISDFFKEYNSHIVFANIEIDNNKADIFLTSRIEGKKINKKLTINNDANFAKKKFYNQIILEVNIIIQDLIKSQNLIDVRTPSFLNVEIKLDKKNNLFEFTNRVKKIDLIDNFYVQELSKDSVLIKIKYLGKIDKIINKLKIQKIDLKLDSGQWQLNII